MEDVIQQPFDRTANPVRTYRPKAGSAGVDIFLVWRGSPKYLVDYIEPIARPFGMRITEISSERRMVLKDDNGTMHARSFRRVRLRCDRDQNLSIGLLAVLEEIESLCRWVHISRLEGEDKHDKGGALS